MFNAKSRPAKNTLTALSLFAALAGANTAHAGAWVPAEGVGYLKLGFADYQADKFRGTNDNFGEFKGQNTSFYGEHGLGNNWAVYGSLLYQSLEQTDSQGIRSSTSGFGDTELGVRYQWQAQPFVLSTSFLVKLPYLYDEDDAFPRGNGQEDYELKVLLGKSLNSYGYVGAEFGYRLRSGAPSDEYRYLLEYGVDLTPNVYFRTKLDGVLSADNADTHNVFGENLSITPEFDSGKLELTTGYKLESNWGLEFTFTREVYGDNILEGNSFQLGLTKVY